MARLTFQGKSLSDPSIGGGILVTPGAVPEPIVYDDWYLPTTGDMGMMWMKLHPSTGNFSTSKYYWTSVEDGSTTALVFGFNFGQAEFGIDKSTIHLYRPAREFTGNVGDYVVGDTGPAGGIIYNIVSNKYYEVTKTDFSAVAWAADDTTETSVLSEFTGTGLTNTIDINTALNSTASAAKLCLDYSVTV